RPFWIPRLTWSPRFQVFEAGGVGHSSFSTTARPPISPVLFSVPSLFAAIHKSADTEQWAPVSGTPLPGGLAKGCWTLATSRAAPVDSTGATSTPPARRFSKLAVVCRSVYPEYFWRISFLSSLPTLVLSSAVSVRTRLGTAHFETTPLSA